MMFWIIIALIITLSTIVYFAEGKGDDGIAGAIGCAVVTSIIGGVIILIACGTASGQEGTAVPGNVETYKIAEKSQMKIDNEYLEFTYEDAAGTLQHFDEKVDEVRYEGSKRDVVEIQTIEYTVRGLMPWDITSQGYTAVIK